MAISRYLENNKISRRSFIQASAITGVGFSVGAFTSVATAGESNKTSQSLGHFVKVSKDNKVTVVIKHLDKGQGVTTGLTAIVAEEMDADWSQMAWEFAPADASKYNNLFWGPYQGTGGSTAIANSWNQLRQAGAAAKHMLISAAASKWGVDASGITVEKGMIKHSSGKSAAFGEFAELASVVEPPKEPKLKDPNEFTLIGTHLPRIDSPEKSTGKANYTVDVRRPGMLSAVIAHPPKFGAVAKSVDDTAAKQIAGVKAVVTVPRGVAVLAENYWAATQGKNALTIEWDESKAEQRGSSELWQEYKELGQKPGAEMRKEGDVAAAISGAANTIEMEFEFPYLAHATMEPLNCVVELKDGECHIFTGSQVPTLDQFIVSKIVELPPEKIFIHTQFAGGSFGRRAVPDSDFVAEAAMIAKAINGSAPVSMQWSREDDMKGGRYRPMAYHKFSAAIDDKGQLSGWHQRIVSQSILRGTPFEGFIQGPADNAISEGGHTLPYKVPNFLADVHEAQVGVPVLWWRSVGHTHNAFATEVFFDEVAHAMKRDPVELRTELLKDHPRHLAVLKLAAEKANWGKSLPKNKAQGVAVHESFGSLVAQVAEVTLNDDGTFKVEKITCAVDCGIAITPDVIKAQMEGGIGYGLGSTLGEKITLNNGSVEQNNFYDYFPLRIHQMPDIDVHIVPSANPPSGVGEPGTPPAGPAVANALRKLTGKALTSLPIGDRVA